MAVAAAPQGVHPRPAQASAPSATAGPSAAAFVWEKEQGRPSCSSLTSGCESTSPARVPECRRWLGQEPTCTSPPGEGQGGLGPPPPSDLGPGKGVLALPSAPPRHEGPGEGEGRAWPPPSPGGSGPSSLRPGLVTGGSDPEDMTLSLNTDVSDPRPHANGENVATTGKNQVAPYLVCPSPLRTADHWGRHSEPVWPSRWFSEAEGTGGLSWPRGHAGPALARCHRPRPSSRPVSPAPSHCADGKSHLLSVGQSKAPALWVPGIILPFAAPQFLSFSASQNALERRAVYFRSAALSARPPHRMMKSWGMSPAL